MPDDNAWIGIERRGRHVVVIAIAQDRRIRVIAGDDRIQERAVSQIRLALAFDATRPLRPILCRTWSFTSDGSSGGSYQRRADQRSSCNLDHRFHSSVASTKNGTSRTSKSDEQKKSAPAHRAITQ